MGALGLWGGSERHQGSHISGGSRAGAMGAAARAWGHGVGVGGRPLPGARHLQCSTRMPQAPGAAWGCVGQRGAGLGPAAAAQCWERGAGRAAHRVPGLGGSAVYCRQQWGELKRPSPSGGGLSFASGGPVCSLHHLRSEAPRSPPWLNNKLRKQEPAGSVNYFNIWQSRRHRQNLKELGQLCCHARPCRAGQTPSIWGRLHPARCCWALPARPALGPSPAARRMAAQPPDQTSICI